MRSLLTAKLLLILCGLPVAYIAWEQTAPNEVSPEDTPLVDIASDQAQVSDQITDVKVIPVSVATDSVELTEKLANIQPTSTLAVEPIYGADSYMSVEDIDSLMQHTDIDHLKKSHAAALGFTKGRIIALRNKLGEYNKQLESTSAASIGVLDAASGELSLQINRIKSLNYDTKAFLIKQLSLLDSSQNCQKQTHIMSKVLKSSHYTCPNAEITFRFERESAEDKYYLTGIKSSEVNALAATLDRLERGEMFQ